MVTHYAIKMDTHQAYRPACGAIPWIGRKRNIKQSSDSENVDCKRCVKTNVFK